MFLLTTEKYLDVKIYIYIYIYIYLDIKVYINIYPIYIDINSIHPPQILKKLSLSEKDYPKNRHQ